MRKSIFKASFQESLNLEEDKFRKFNEKSYNDAIRYFRDGGPSFKFKLIYFILSFFCPIGLAYLIMLLSRVIADRGVFLGYSTMTTVLVPSWLYLLFLFLWLSLILIGKLLNQSFILIYRMQFHVQVTMLLWIVIEMNFIYVMIYEPTLTIFGTVFLFILFIILGYIMIRIQQRHLRKHLYGDINQVDSIEKNLKFIATYGMGFLGIAIFIKVLISNFTGGITESLEYLGFFLSWLILDIGVMSYFIFVLSSHFLPAYYKLRYPEAYRKYEMKSVEEWYGKKYLKKHKELLENE